MKVKFEGKCCGDCLFFLANGDVPEGKTGDEFASQIKAFHDRSDEDMKHMCIASNEETDGEFSWRQCECCGSRLGGSRHNFVILEKGE